MPRCSLSLKVELIVDFSLWLCRLMQAVFGCQMSSAILEWVMKCFKHSETYFLCKLISHSFAHTMVVSLASEA